MSCALGETGWRNSIVTKAMLLLFSNREQPDRRGGRASPTSFRPRMSRKMLAGMSMPKRAKSDSSPLPVVGEGLGEARRSGVAPPARTLPSWGGACRFRSIQIGMTCRPNAKLPSPFSSRPDSVLRVQGQSLGDLSASGAVPRSQLAEPGSLRSTQPLKSNTGVQYRGLPVGVKLR